MTGQKNPFCQNAKIKNEKNIEKYAKKLFTNCIFCSTIENELMAKPEIVAIYKLAEKDVNVLNLKKKISNLGKLREEELNEVARKREIWTMKNFILVHIGFAIFLFIILFMYNKLYTAREKNWRRKQNVEKFIENIR